jgi:ribosomal protein S27AE
MLSFIKNLFKSGDGVKVTILKSDDDLTNSVKENKFYDKARFCPKCSVAAFDVEYNDSHTSAISSCTRCGSTWKTELI